MNQNQQNAYTCGGVSLKTVNASKTPIAYSISYTYHLLLDDSLIFKHPNLAMYLIQSSIDTIQALILDTVLYTACDLRQYLYSDQTTLAFAAFKRDQPFGACGKDCLIVHGSVSSYLSNDVQGLVQCNALQAIHDLLASTRVERVQNVVSVTPEATTNDTVLCLPATTTSNSSAVAAVDNFSSNSYYTCKGALGNASSATVSIKPAQIKFAYTLTVTDTSVDYSALAKSIEQLLFYDLLESSCYTSAAVQKEDLLSVSTSHSDAVSTACGPNCYNIEGVVSFQYLDTFGLIQCAIINSLFNTFQGDAIANLGGVASVTFDSQDLLYTCIGNDLSKDPEYNPGNAFNYTQTTSTMQEAVNMRASSSNSNKFTSVAIGSCVGFAAIMMVVILFTRRMQASAETKLSMDGAIVPMEPEEECTPRKLFVDDYVDDKNEVRYGIRPAIYYNEFGVDSFRTWIN
jgi:hypothetical protein